MTLTITLKPVEDFKTYMYNYTGVTYELTLDKIPKRDEIYTILLYNSQLMLLGKEQTDDLFVTRIGRTIHAAFDEKHIWIPGNYFLLLRKSGSEVYRFDIELDEAGEFLTEKPVLCARMSDEDILSGRLCDKDHQWEKLSRLPGTGQMKRWLAERARRYELNEYRLAWNEASLEYCNNLLISSRIPDSLNPAIIPLLQLAEVRGERKIGDCTTFYDSTRSFPYDSLHDFCERRHSKEDSLFDVDDFAVEKTVYVFYNVGSLMNTGGKIIMKTLLSHCLGKDKTMVFCGTPQEISDLLEQYPSLRHHFPKENRLLQEPYSKEEMMHVFFERLKAARLTLLAEATDKLCRLLSAAYDQGAITHWDEEQMDEYIETQLKPSYCRNAIRCIAEKEVSWELRHVQGEDIDEKVFADHRSDYNEALRELNEMVGLGEIKRSITTLSNRMKFCQERKELGLRSSENVAYHTILTGNPGTGKTTVARLLGKIYHSLGLLSKGEVVCVDRARMIGRYIGETEENMKQILKEAQGNVLFVDEAYTLYIKDDEKDFGKQAVECLLDVLSRKNPDMLIIFAGYEKEMEELMCINPGLAGRFPYRYRFENYSADELLQIAEKILEKDDYILTLDARSLLSQTIRDVLAGKPENFSNARWVEQLVKNGIIPALADRVSGMPHVLDKQTYQRIETTDVKVAAEKFCPKPREIKRRPVIGFCA